MERRREMRILIVDDSVHVQRQLRVFLESDGHTDLAFASSPREAFDLLGLDGDAPGPAADLVLMDVDMGAVGGIEATRRVKADPRYGDVPVIMCTAETGQDCLVEAFAAGAVDYITKPLRKVELLARVRSFLRLREETLIRKQRERELEVVNGELRHANEKLRKLAASDGLTGLPNRRYFDETIEREWKKSARQKAPLALLMLDVDFFKAYNDLLGHLEGDRCLQAMAGALQRAVKRPSDTPCRYGGEEFAVVLPETDAAGAESVARSIQEAVAALRLPHAGSRVNEFVTVSIGVASIVASAGEGHERLIRTADQALYRAKEGGRNRSLVFRD